MQHSNIDFYSGFMYFVPIWISRHPYLTLGGFDQLPFLNDWAVMFDKSREQNRTWGSWVRGTYATTVLSCPVTTNEYIFKDCPGLKRTWDRLVFVYCTNANSPETVFWRSNKTIKRRLVQNLKTFWKTWRRRNFGRWRFWNLPCFWQRRINTHANEITLMEQW